MNSNKMAAEGSSLLLNLCRILGVVERNEVRCCNMTTTQGLAMLAFAGRERIPMRELSDSLGLAPSTMTRITDNLVRDGYLDRVQDTKDRRSVYVAPTHAGKQKIADLAKCYERFWQGMCACVPVEKRDEVVSSLTVLNEALEKARFNCCAR